MISLGSIIMTLIGILLVVFLALSIKKGKAVIDAYKSRTDTIYYKYINNYKLNPHKKKIDNIIHILLILYLVVLIIRTFVLLYNVSILIYGTDHNFISQFSSFIIYVGIGSQFFIWMNISNKKSETGKYNKLLIGLAMLSLFIYIICLLSLLLKPETHLIIIVGTCLVENLILMFDKVSYYFVVFSDYTISVFNNIVDSVKSCVSSLMSCVKEIKNKIDIKKPSSNKVGGNYKAMSRRGIWIQILQKIFYPNYQLQHHAINRKGICAGLPGLVAANCTNEVPPNIANTSNNTNIRNTGNMNSTKELGHTNSISKGVQDVNPRKRSINIEDSSNEPNKKVQKLDFPHRVHQHNHPNLGNNLQKTKDNREPLMVAYKALTTGSNSIDELGPCLNNISYNERWNNNNWNMYKKIQWEVIKGIKSSTVSTADRDNLILLIRKWTYEDHLRTMGNVMDVSKFIKEDSEYRVSLSFPKYDIKTGEFINKEAKFNNIIARLIQESNNTFWIEDPIYPSNSIINVIYGERVPRIKEVDWNHTRHGDFTSCLISKVSDYWKLSGKEDGPMFNKLKEEIKRQNALNRDFWKLTSIRKDNIMTEWSAARGIKKVEDLRGKKEVGGLMGYNNFLKYTIWEDQKCLPPRKNS
jgi:hypothetical protein